MTSVCYVLDVGLPYFVLSYQSGVCAVFTTLTPKCSANVFSKRCLRSSTVQPWVSVWFWNWREWLSTLQLSRSLWGKTTSPSLALVS